MTFRATGSRGGHVAVAVDLVTLSLGDGSHVDAGAAEIAKASIFSDVQRRLRAAHVTHARPRLT